MTFTNTKESGFESLIVKWLVDQNGYEEGQNATTIKHMQLMRLAYFAFSKTLSRKRWKN